MSTLGKILIAFQVVLSLLFMTFAGMVAATQETWKVKAEKVTKELKDATDTRESLRNEFATFRTNAEGDITKVTEERTAARAEKAGLVEERDQLQKVNKELTDEKAAALQAQSVAADESKARLEESRLLREVNEKLRQSRDDLYRLKLQLEDTIRSRDVDLNLAQAKIRANIDELGKLRKQVQAASITGNPGDAASDVPPPEIVFGEVRETKPPKSSGGTELVAVSLGSDDGLQKGHTLIVYRPADAKNRQPKYVCQIKVVETTPQTAVAEVIRSTRNGVIQKGDHVTTKL